MYSKVYSNRLIRLNQTFVNLFSTSPNFEEKKHLVTLKQRKPINHDTYLFTFAYDDVTIKTEQFVTQHFVIYGYQPNGNYLSRKYTAISPLFQEGQFSIPIKIYRPNTHPLYPDGGEFTPWLENLEIGSEIWVERRVGPIVYLGEGHCILNPKINQSIKFFKQILMICGGTGITPMFQLLQRIFNDTQDQTKVSLIYANKSEQDILLRDELELLSKAFPERFKLFLTLDKAVDQWKGYDGYVDLEMMKKSFPQPNDETLGTTCGPKPMNLLILRLYKEFGLNEDHILKF